MIEEYMHEYIPSPRYRVYRTSRDELMFFDRFMNTYSYNDFKNYKQGFDNFRRTGNLDVLDQRELPLLELLEVVFEFDEFNELMENFPEDFI